MSDQIDVAFVQQYKNNLYRLAQQNGSKLVGTTMKEDITGKAKYFERLGATSAAKRTSRHADVVTTDTPHSRRKVTIDDYEVADYIDDQDKLRLLIDPTSAYMVNMADALGRQLDDIIIDAADGNATSVDAADATSTVAVAHTVDEDFNTANSDIIVEKVIEARRIKMANEVNLNQPTFFALDSTALHNLLQETEVSSIDYNSVKALVRGEINTFMGYNFIQTERLNNSSGGFKNCLAYTKDSIGLAMAKEINGRISEVPTKGYATLVYASLTAGAVRIHEDGLVVVEAYRT